MKVAIAGAGITGAYLYRLLQNRGCAVHLYERQQKSGCGLTPCGWGTSAGFVALLAKAGLDADNYILQRFDHLLMDEVRVQGNLLTIDKPQLVRDLLQDAEVRFTTLPLGDYDRVIDATGVARALLPPVADDLTLDCCQFLVQSEQPLLNRVHLGGIGYAWSLPLAEHRYHVGCGCLLLDPRQHLEQLGWLADVAANGDQRILCSCSGKIRLTGPHQSQPFVANLHGTEVWGIGEAIGCVAPLAGEGIVPGLRSVQLLLTAWDNPAQYRQAVLDEFHWIREERAIIDRLRRGRSIGLRQARILRRNYQRMGMGMGMGMDVSLRDAITLLQRMGSPSGR